MSKMLDKHFEMFTAIAQTTSRVTDALKAFAKSQQILSRLACTQYRNIWWIRQKETYVATLDSCACMRDLAHQNYLNQFREIRSQMSIKDLL